jgi:hypothetical protein
MSSAVDIVLDGAQLSGLALGWLDPVEQGTGFERLELEVSFSGLLVLDESFTSAAAALSFLDDQLFEIAPASGPAGDVALRIAMTYFGSAPNAGFGASFVVAALPEPSGGALLAAVVVLLGRWAGGARRA